MIQHAVDAPTRSHMHFLQVVLVLSVLSQRECCCSDHQTTLRFGVQVSELQQKNRTFMRSKYCRPQSSLFCHTDSAVEFSSSVERKKERNWYQMWNLMFMNSELSGHRKLPPYPPQCSGSGLQRSRTSAGSEARENSRTTVFLMSLDLEVVFPIQAPNSQKVVQMICGDCPPLMNFLFFFNEIFWMSTFFSTTS